MSKVSMIEQRAKDLDEARRIRLVHPKDIDVDKYIKASDITHQVHEPWQWLQGMISDVEGLEGIDFELPGNKTFTFGLNPQYKDVLMSKNAELDTFFDQYVDSNGNWNHEAFNMHRAVVDNIDEIVKAVYSQGLSDGQRKVVQNVANVQTMVPQTAGPGGQQSTLSQQIESILGQQDSMMRIKF